MGSDRSWNLGLCHIVGTRAPTPPFINPGLPLEKGDSNEGVRSEGKKADGGGGSGCERGVGNRVNQGGGSAARLVLVRRRRLRYPLEPRFSPRLGGQRLPTCNAHYPWA